MLTTTTGLFLLDGEDEIPEEEEELAPTEKPKHLNSSVIGRFGALKVDNKKLI